MCSSSPSSRIVRSMFKIDPFHRNSNIRTPTPIHTPSPRRLSGTSPCIFARVGYRSFVSPMSSLADVNHSTPNPTTKTVRVVVKGRVQGVFYRNWTVQNAKELGLKGWVRNRRDGSVEALLSGSPGKVQEMEQRCRRGPPAAMVTGFEVSPCSDDPGTGFERRQTV